MRSQHSGTRSYISYSKGKPMYFPYINFIIIVMDNNEWETKKIGFSVILYGRSGNYWA